MNLLRHCLQAVVDKGVADPERMAVGGHSYGAFMAANLLAHAGHLFAAGIARSGAYNRRVLSSCLWLALQLAGARGHSFAGIARSGAYDWRVRCCTQLPKHEAALGPKRSSEPCPAAALDAAPAPKPCLKNPQSIGVASVDSGLMAILLLRTGR